MAAAVVKFWKENKIDQEFDWPVTVVADAFMTHYWREKLQDAPFPLERMLRGWLTAKDGLNSVWEAEEGPDSFEELYIQVRDRTKAELAQHEG